MTSDDDGGANRGILLFAVLHVLCCGIPLLVLSGVSLAFVAPYWPVAAGLLALLGLIGFTWYVRRGCATCPRNEARRSPQLASGEPLASRRPGHGEPLKFLEPQPSVRR